MAAFRYSFSSPLSAVSYFQMKSFVLSGIKHVYVYVATTKISNNLWSNEDSSLPELLFS